MNMVLSTVRQEALRIDRMLESYQLEKEKLPKGSLSEKRVGDKIYYYLKYRDGNRIVSQYVASDNVNTVQEQIAHRNHIESMIRSLKAEKKMAQRILEEYT